MRNLFVDRPPMIVQNIIYSYNTIASTIIAVNFYGPLITLPNDNIANELFVKMLLSRSK